MDRDDGGQGSEQPPEPSEAAEATVDVDRLLDGEDPHTSRRDDVDHWRQVYSDLLAFKEEVLALTQKRLGSMGATAAREIETTDLPVLEAEAARLRRRLGYWTRRSTGAEADTASD